MNRVKRLRRSGKRRVPTGRKWAARLGQGMPWYSPGNTVPARNIRCLYAETAWFGILSGLTATFVSVFALRLGASTEQVGWLAALPALVNVIWLIPAARLIERRRRRLPLVLFTGLAQRLGYLAMAAMPFVLVTGRIEALIVIQTLITLPTAVINTALTAMIPDLVSAEHRGQVMSTRWLILAAVSTLAALAGGKFLDLLPVPLNYQILLGVGSALSLLGLLRMRRMKLPDRVPARRAESPAGRGGGQRPRGGLRTVFSHKGFVRFAIAAFIFHWGIYLPAALWSVLRVRDLGATDTWIGLIAVIVDASMIAGYFLWGKVRVYWGDRLLLIVSSLAVSIYTGLTALVPSITWMIPTSIVGGFTWAGCNLALFNVLLAVCPDDRRATYVALYTALLNITAFAGPLLGAALSGGIGIRWAFVVSTGLRLAGALLFILLLPRLQGQAAARAV
jgi:MFS family permease